MQDYDDYELLIKDGGSTDGTEHRTWADHHVRFVSSKDGGIFDAMNQALWMAKGDYVCFLNAGDYFLDGQVLRTMSELVREYPVVDLFYGDVRKQESRCGYELYPDQLNRFFLFTHSICHQCWFLRRTVYLTANGFETAHTDMADCRLLLRLLIRDGISYRHLPRVIVNYKGGGSSADPRKQKKNEECLNEMRRKLFGPLEYRLFHFTWRTRQALKLLCYDRLLHRFWRKIQSIRVRSRGCGVGFGPYNTSPDSSERVDRSPGGARSSLSSQHGRE